MELHEPLACNVIISRVGSLVTAVGAISVWGVAQVELYSCGTSWPQVVHKWLEGTIAGVVVDVRFGHNAVIAAPAAKDRF